MQSRSSFSVPFRATLAALSLSLAGAAFSQEYFSTDNLVPSPWYLSTEWAQFGDGSSIRLPAVQVLGGRIYPPDPGHVADSFFDVMARVERNPGPQQYNAPGFGMAHYVWRQPGPPNVFDTELLQLDLSGGDLPAGMMIRESATRPSTGHTTIRSVQGGFMVDSFFDVFFDLSTDGGQTWLPAIQSVRMHGAASPVPEPASLAVLGLGLAAIGNRKSRIYSRRQLLTWRRK